MTLILNLKISPLSSFDKCHLTTFVINNCFVKVRLNILFKTFLKPICNLMPLLTYKLCKFTIKTEGDNMKRLNQTEYTRLLIKISKMYYFDNYTQLEISKKLKISRPDVSRLLTDARKKGIVNITIRSTSRDFSDLERDLEKKFGLNEVIVVQSDKSEVVTKQNLGMAAANYLERIMQDNMKIGVSWGTTIQEMVKYLNPSKEYKNISVFQLTGGVSGGELDIQAGELCRKIAEVYKGRAIILYAPAFVKNEFIKNTIFESNRDIIETLNAAKKCDVAIVGIGAAHNSTNLLWENIFNEDYLEDLIAKGAVGDICGRYFNIEGKICSPEMDSRTIGVSIDDLKKMKITVGVGGGEKKIQAIYGAIKGKIINVLITDEAVARELLKDV